MIHLSPDWNAWHPLMVHFPIALLLVAPLFVVLGCIFPSSKSRPYLICAVTLMALGTLAAIAAVATGEAAIQGISAPPATKVVLEQHHKLAEITEELFAVLTVALAGMLIVPQLLRRELEFRMNAALLAAFLVFYATGALFLVNTAMQGGRLVHELGLKAPVVTGVGLMKGNNYAMQKGVAAH